MFKKRTDEMPPFFDNPGSRTMEPMVVTRGEVDDAEEKGIPGLDAGSGCASPTFHSHTRSHLMRDFGRFEQALGKILRVYYGCIGRLAKTGGRAVIVLQGTGSCTPGGTNQLGQTVFNPIDLSKLAMIDDLVVSIRKGDSCTGRGRGSLDTEEGV